MDRSSGGSASVDSSSSAAASTSPALPLPFPLPSSSSSVSASFTHSLSRLASSPSPSSSPSSSSPGSAAAVSSSSTPSDQSGSEAAGHWMSPSSNSSSQSTPSAASPPSPSLSTSSSSLHSHMSPSVLPRVRHDKHRRNASEVRRRSEMKEAFQELQAAADCSQSGRYHVLTQAAAVIRGLQATLQRLRDEGAAQHIQHMTQPTHTASSSSTSLLTSTSTTLPHSTGASTSPSASSSSSSASSSQSSPLSPPSPHWLSAASELCAHIPLPACVASPATGSLVSANDGFLHLVDSVSLSFLLQTHSLHSIAQLHPTTSALLRRAAEGIHPSQGRGVKEERGSEEGGGQPLAFPSFPSSVSSASPLSTRLLHTEAVLVQTLGGDVRPCHLSLVLCHPSPASPHRGSGPLVLCVFAPLATPPLPPSASSSLSLPSMRPPPPSFASPAPPSSSSLPFGASGGPQPFHLSLQSLLPRLPPSLAPPLDVSSSSSASQPLLPSPWSAPLHQQSFQALPSSLASSPFPPFPPSSSSFASSSSSPSLSLRGLDASAAIRSLYSNVAPSSSSPPPSSFSRSSSPAPYEAPPLLSSTSPSPFAVEPLTSASAAQPSHSHLQSQSPWWLHWAAKAAQQPPQQMQPSPHYQQLPPHYLPSPSQPLPLELLGRGGGGGGGMGPDSGGGHGLTPGHPQMPSSLTPFHPSHYSLASFDSSASSVDKATPTLHPFDFHPPPR